MNIDIKKLTIKEAGDLLRKGEITSVALLEECLKNIKEKNTELNIFLEVFDDAKSQAEKADKLLKENKGGALCGIPIALKDNILVEGHKNSSGSKILENYIASYNAFVVERLKESGAVLIGRTNMDEFAMGSSTENSAFGPVKNPLDPTRVPGGSSGGSSASLVAGMALGALGSDTGGSIRQPASFCGIVGMKPTYGAVSRSGLTAMSSSLDVIGPFAKNSEDAQIIFECISGKDRMDSTSRDVYQKDAPENTITKKVIGVPKEFIKNISEDVLNNFNEVLKNLEKSGFTIKDIDLPYTKYSLAVYYIIMPAEVSTNLSRLDGMRYGLRKEGDSMFDTYKKSRSVGFGPETRRRVMLGTYVLSHGYYDAYYNKAWKVRREIMKEYDNVFKEVDFVLTPTTPTSAFKFGEKSNPVDMYLSDIFTVSANLAGLPSISIPSGFSEAKMPLGVLFTAPIAKDFSLFEMEKYIK